MNEFVALKRCTRCGNHQPLIAFGVQTRSSSGLSSICKLCHNLYNKRSAIRNKARHLASPPDQYGLKKCCRCAEIKSKTTFRRNNRKKDGFCDYCNECDSYFRRKRKYGVGKSEVLAFAATQNGKCAICMKLLVPGRDTHVDHDHKTGVVRGLLCFVCNRGIGMFRDSDEILSRAVDYLRRTK